MPAKTVLKWMFRLPAKAVLASGYDLIERYIASSPSIWFNPYLSAKIRPYRPDVETYVIREIEPSQISKHDENNLPVPFPEKFMYGHLTVDQFLSSGKAEAERIRRITESSGFSFAAARRILDFGCADGRIIRWFYNISEKCEVWGVDLLGEYIMVCQQYLSPPFRFATNTSEPHLQFEDNSFDFIYACSVFTHIADLADAWLLELRRIMRPGGRLYITVHDDRSIAVCLDPEKVRRFPFFLEPLRDKLEALEKQESYLGTNYTMFTIHRSPGPGGHREAQVFYKTCYLHQHLGSMFNILSITPETYAAFQTTYLLEKPVS